MSYQTPTSNALPWIGGFNPRDLPKTICFDEQDLPNNNVKADYPVRLIRRPEIEIASSWLRQIVVLDEAGVRIRLQARLEESSFGGVAGDQYEQHSKPSWPFAESLMILGAVADPMVALPDEAVSSQEELVHQLHLNKVQTSMGTTVDRTHKWTEPCVIAYSHPENSNDDWRNRVLEIALQMGIQTVVQIFDGIWTVISFNATRIRGFTVTQSVSASVTQDAERKCPMQAAPRSGEYCRMRGGPWTSNSITVASGWFAHRDRLVMALGCDTCEGERYQFQGAIFTDGGPIPVVPIPSSTRWLGADD